MDNKEYAGFWIRLGAVLIDMVIIFFVLLIPLSFIYGEEYWLGDKFIYGFWDIMLSYVAPFIATIWFWLRFLGTPGKMATKLEIVDAATGNKMSTGQAIGRYFAYIVATLPFCLGFIWIGIDKRKQGWHDKLAGTVVLRNTGKESVKFEEKL
ncbi:MAG: RDD family protein [Gammaproteobacteria bacterium HGW-Gammaproteobacteria-15]|nr:MAG: RDD family protein [Gammaproteobacteria bacterium HGW-Gammaproteobacteria-15]